MGNRTGGFYRISDHRATPEDKEAHRDGDRQVEVYGSGGLTFSSKARVLWLALLPFLLSNMAGWMCSARTRQSPWRFRLHRLSYGLGALALTVNAFLVAVMIAADILAYQVARAGLAGHQWWTTPLRWHTIADHPARQVLIGMTVVVMLLLVLLGVAGRSWRYEAVRPPYSTETMPKAMSRKVTASALQGGLADNEFWDGESSVRLLTWVHVAVIGGFLAIVLAITTKGLTAGSSHVSALGGIAIGLGAATVALGVGYICLDALATPGIFDVPGISRSAGGAYADYLRSWATYLLVPAVAALIASGVFAWLQSGGPAGRTADLPGMTGVIGWTTLAIAVPVAVALVSALLGLSGSRGALFGGPWVTLVLAFSLLNTVMLGAGIAAAHIAGPVTSNATAAVTPPHRMIYLPYLITAGVPLAAVAALAAGGVFTLTELARRLRPRQLPEEMRKAYQEQYRALIDGQPEQMKIWYWSGLPPFSAYSDVFRAGRHSLWERKVARAQLRGSTVFNVGRLLWGIIIAQLAVILCAWRFHWQLSAFISILGVAIAGLALPTRLGFLYSKWQDPAQRSMTIFWDVAAFWPRSYHPFSPPCYSEQAVPDLQARMWLLGDIGRKLILVAHGQGTMWAVAALVQPGTRPGDQRLTLVTFGSTIGTLYAWGFPAYVDRPLLAPLVPGGAARIDRWHNLYYPTDPIAGPAAGHLFDAEDGSPVDLTLPDPERCWYIYRDYPPMPRGHSGYWEDPRVWTLVNKVTADAQGIPVSAVSHQDPPSDAAETRPSNLSSE